MRCLRFQVRRAVPMVCGNWRQEVRQSAQTRVGPQWALYIRDRSLIISLIYIFIVYLARKKICSCGIWTLSCEPQGVKRFLIIRALLLDLYVRKIFRFSRLTFQMLGEMSKRCIFPRLKEL